MDQNLLDKYWNAETSSQEEEQLRQHPEGMSAAEAAYFSMITEARKQKSKLTIEDIKAYNERNAAPVQAKVIRPLFRWVASAAAVLVFAAAGTGLWQYSQQTTQSAQMAETFDDPYEAYEEVKEALAFVSAKLNKSQNEALINIKKAGEYADMFK